MDKTMSWITQYLVALAAFALVDWIWLGTIAKSVYRDNIGPLLLDKPNLGAAVAFYVLFLAGLVFFVIHPAVSANSLGYALGAGAFFGLVTYATWDLTNLAVLKGFPLRMAIIDMAWGTFLAASVSTITYLVVTKLLPSWAA